MTVALKLQVGEFDMEAIRFATGSVVAFHAPGTVVPEFTKLLHVAAAVNVPLLPTQMLTPVVVRGPVLIATGMETDELQPSLKAFNIYVPAAAEVTLEIEGLNAVKLNPFGPVQL